MRSEFLGDCARFTGLAETLNETHYLVPRMTEEELCQAIVEPAELKNGRIEDELVDRLIDDIKAQEDQLPILQHTLLWMWIQEEEKPRASRALVTTPRIHLGLAEYEQGRKPARPPRPLCPSTATGSWRGCRPRNAGSRRSCSAGWSRSRSTAAGFGGRPGAARSLSLPRSSSMSSSVSSMPSAPRTPRLSTPAGRASATTPRSTSCTRA